MSDSNNIPDPILWHEGLLLMPQHFQAADQYHEASLNYRMMSFNPFSWGIHSIEIDQGLLLQGVFRVEHLSAVMPDGQIVNFNRKNSGDIKLEIIVDATAAAQEEGLSLWLTIPRYTEGILVDDETARYHSRETIIRDSITGEEISVSGLRPNMTLWAGNIPPSRFSALPLAHVKAEGAKIQLTNFVPPLMLVQEGTDLYSLCHTLAVKIRSKASMLAERISSLNANETALLLETRFHLSGLLAGLSAFEALLHSEAAHPLTLFTALHNLAGGAASMGGTLLPPRVDYEHTDPMRCFKKLISFICRMVEAGIPEIYKTHTFEQTDYSFTLDLTNIPHDEDSYIIGVTSEQNNDPQKIKTWMDRAVIGMNKKLNKLMKQRSIGANRKLLKRIPGMMTSSKIILYKIKSTPADSISGELIIAGVAEGPETQRPSSIYLFTRIKAKDTALNTEHSSKNSLPTLDSSVPKGEE